MSAKYQVYSLLRKILPKMWIQRIGQSAVTVSIRNQFFRPEGQSEIVTGQVHWHGHDFRFSAPYQVLYRAQASGIENSICRLARARLGEGDTAIDVGANYGFISIVMGKGIGENG